MYHDILNILGKRLQEHSTAHVTLTGCTALGTDNGGRSLSKARAETVKTYLSDVWHVAPNRIQVASRELPQNYSPRSDSDGMAENRRVEIASNDASILAPLSLSDTLRLTTPPIVRFYPEAVSEAGVASWRIEALQDGSKLYSSSGTRLPKMLDWNLNNDQQHIPKAPGKLDISFTVVDSANTTRFASDTLSILQLTLRAKKRELAGDAEIQHYSLLLFDFKSSELSLRDQEVLKFIKSHISEHSVVKVEGYADRIGNAEVNHTLATARARAAAAVLGVETGMVSGSDQLLYDNATPEGRFYSRTVEVTITTPQTSPQ
jgi:outer membrane protein OmpA-like peptidoglycan-associated protein